MKTNQKPTEAKKQARHIINVIVITHACTDMQCHCAMCATRNGESSTNDELNEIEESILGVELYELTKEAKEVLKNNGFHFHTNKP